MEFEEILKRRRSVRRFTNQQVREETIIQIMNEARHAPTWANAQETRIYVAAKGTARMIRKEYEEASAKGLGLSDYSFTHTITDLCSRKNNSHKFYLSKTAENRIDDFRWFFYTDDNGSVLTDASTPFGLEPSGTYHMGSSNVSQARQELLQKVVTRDGR